MSRNTQTLLAELTRRGIRLRFEGDLLQYHPRSAMTPDLLERVRAHKAELRSLLEFDWQRDTVPAEPCPACGSYHAWWDALDGKHCAQCDPPTKGLHWLKQAERIRKKHKKASLSGSKGLTADLINLVEGCRI